LNEKASQQAQLNILITSVSPNSSSLDVQEDTRGAITTNVALCRASDLAPSSNFVLILLDESRHAPASLDSTSGT
jgi:hypothetical protein